MKNKLNIKSIVSKLLREGEEPFFYLAPDIVGSINNPVRDKEKGIVVGLQETSMGKEQIKFISVQFTNTPFNKLTASERKNIARDVAELAKAHFVLHKPEDFVWVSFVESGHYIVFEYSRSVDFYAFESSELVPVVSNSTVFQFPHDKNQHK